MFNNIERLGYGIVWLAWVYIVASSDVFYRVSWIAQLSVGVLFLASLIILLKGESKNAK